jgi:integrase
VGYIEKRSGSYRVRYRSPSGKQTSKTFARKTDADRFLRESEVAVDRGQWIDPRSAEMSLNEWAVEFLLLARRLSPRTQGTYERDLTQYVLPRFGTYRLGKLPPGEIENWLNDEVAGGLARSSVHRHYRTMRRVMQVAIDKEKVLHNPCDRVQPPHVPKTEMTFLTWDQAVDLAEEHTERLRAFVYLAVDSGMRWSELVGLRRSRLDLQRGKVKVTEQLIRLTSGEWVRKEPKTSAGVRSITISPVTKELMERHVARFSAHGPDGLVFPNRAGNPFVSSSYWNNQLTPALKRLRFKCRFHDLRHTSVAFAIAEGAHPKAIQVRMGHSSITVTLDRYGHLFPELDEAIATSFGARLLEARSRDRIVDTAAVLPARSA